MVDDVLVDRRTGGDEDGDARSLPSTGATELLPRRRDRTRIAGQDRHVQAADVDAQLERIRRDDAEDLAVAQTAFDRPPLGGQVAAAIAAYPAARPVALAQRLAETGQQDLDRHPRPAEDDRLATGAQEGQRPALGERRRRAACAAGRLHDGRVDQQDVALAGGCAVPVDQSGGSARQHRRQLRGVPDGGRATDDDRPAAVVGADPQKPAQDVGHVAAEHAPVRVELVDHDHLQLLEQLEPLGVVGEDRRVEHVRVGHDDLPGGAHRRADRGRRVAVVGRGDDRQAGCAGEFAELGYLVLPERLGREQEQPAGGGILRDGLERRQGVAQGLARCRRGDHDDVLTGVDGIDRLELVGVQPLDLATREAADDALVEPGRHVGVRGLARRDDLVVDDAAGERGLLQQALENRRGVGGGVGAHRRDSGY